MGEINGIWYKESGEIKQNPPRPFIDLNQQPPLSYHLINLGKQLNNFSGIDALAFETSRGCPFKCAFCYNTYFNQRKWRALDPEQTLFRMKRVVEQYGIRGFVFSDDNFFTDLDRAHNILEGIVKQKQNIMWCKGDIRLDQLSRLDDEFMELIERSGCHSLAIGIESGSQRIADLMRKEIDLSQVIALNRRLAKYKILATYLFILGIPGETRADVAESASLMLKLLDDNPNARNGVQIYVPYPGTELFDLSVQYGLQVPQKLEDWIAYSWMNRKVSYPWLSAEMRGLLRMLSFCGAFMPSEKIKGQLSRGVSPIISLVAKLYYPVVRARVKGLHYKFMPELKVSELLGFRGY